MTVETIFIIRWTPTCDMCGDNLGDKGEFICPSCKSKFINNLFCQLRDLSVLEVDTTAFQPYLKYRSATAGDLGKAKVLLTVANVPLPLWLRYEKTQEGFHIYQVTNPGYEKTRYWVTAPIGH